MNSSNRRKSDKKGGNPRKKNGKEEVPESVKTVLNLEELLDLIVALVLTYSDDFKDACRKEIRSLSLVSKAWLSSVSRVLYKTGLPLIQFNFSSFFAADGTIKMVNPNVKTLNNFVKSYSSAFAANDRNAPAYSLRVDTQFFQNKKFNILKNCFLHCGKGLVQLEMDHLKGVCMPNCPSKMPKFSFPNLKKICFDVTSEYKRQSSSESELDSDKEEKMYTRILNVGNLLKHFLEASDSLKELTLQTDIELSNMGFDNFLLPSKLSTLSISVIMDMEDVELLSQNRLPRLFELDVSFRDGLVLDSSVFTMLNNWRKWLRKLSLGLVWEPDMPLINLHFPVMEKLRELKLYSTPDFELHQTDGSLDICFPGLMDLELTLTKSGFQDWCVNSVFRTVEDLSVNLYDCQREESIPMDLQSIQHTGMAFPNVTTLHIQVLGNETAVLHYIFTEMVQLENLDLFVCGTASIKSSNFWDALLIGTTTEIVKKLKRSLDNPDIAEVLENSSTPSIRGLTNLSALSLSTHPKTGVLGKKRQLISEISFTYAFLKMQNLGSLNLRGRFEIPAEMRKLLKPKMEPFFVLV